MDQSEVVQLAMDVVRAHLNWAIDHPEKLTIEVASVANESTGWPSTTFDVWVDPEDFDVVAGNPDASPLREIKRFLSGRTQHFEHHFGINIKRIGDG